MEGILGLAKAFQDDFSIGVAVSPRSLGSHKDLILRHFNSLTAENHMKPQWTQPREGEFTFDMGDKVADFAMNHGMRLRGHTLVWHNQTPDWFFMDGEEEAGRELVLSRMDAHMRQVIAHYRGKVYIWDVVNEAVNDDGEGEAMRSSRWLRLGGEGFIERAFRTAMDADGDTLLCYNDYNEVRPVKSRRIYEMVKALRGSGVRVDCVGMQGHYNAYGPSMEDLRAAIELYASLGVMIQLTELDVSLFRFDDKSHLEAPGEELLALQGQYYEELFTLLRDYRKVIDNVTLWGAADDISWLNNFPVKNRRNWPLPFGDNQEPKPAYYGMIRASGKG